jgi:hypothetical protein
MPGCEATTTGDDTMKTFHAFAFAVALVTATAAAQQNPTASAQPAQQSSGVERVGDPVPKAEVREGIQAGTDQLFDVLDTNKDGKLSPEEFQKMAQPQTPSPAPSTGNQSATR